MGRKSGYFFATVKYFFTVGFFGGNVEFKVLMQLLIGIVGFAIWTFIVFYAPDLNNSEYLKFVQGSVLTVVALALRDTVQSKTEQPAQKDEAKQEPQQLN